MKRIFALFLSLILLATCFYAFAENVPKTKLKVANYAVLETGYAEFWENIKQGFEDKYPNIEVEYIQAPYGEILNQTINMAGAGNKADILFGEISWIPVLEDSGLSVPINQVLSEEFLADFYPNHLEACSIDGTAYGLPLYVSPFVLYYNKDLFTKAGLDPEKAPTTYEEMLEMAQKLSELKTDDGNKVYAFGQTTASVPISGASLDAFLNNFGASLLNEDKTLATDSDAFKEASETLALLHKNAYSPENAKLKDLRNLFAIGQLAMYYDQSWGFNGVKTINPDAVKFAASAKPLKGGSGQGASNLQSNVFMYMDNGEENRQAARLFTEYLLSSEVFAVYLTDLTPAYPARKSMAEDPNFKENPVLSGAKGASENTMPKVFVGNMDSLYLELCTFAQAITLGQKDFDTAYAEFKAEAQQLLEQ